MDDFRFMISNDPTPIQIAPRERIIGIVPSHQNEFIVDLVNPTSGDFFKSIQLRYSLHFQDSIENNNLMGMQFLLSKTSNYWKEIINSIIWLEFNSMMKTKFKSVLELASIDEQGLSGASENEESRSLPHSIYLADKPLIKSKISRNRKRTIYPMTTPGPEYTDDLEVKRAAMEKVQPIMDKFLENLTRTTIQLFGFNPIKIIDYRIGEE
jgi:hypothetical protein